MKKSERDIQMLGSQAVLEGNLVFEGSLFMNGHAKGTIESRNGSIVVGEEAVLHADIFVRNATINGEINGTVRAAERIELHPPARVNGVLEAPVVVMEEGVIFEGNCRIKPKGQAAPQTVLTPSTGAAKTENPAEPAAKSPAPPGSAENKESSKGEKN
jgi:cytoskeletal protein CcmA (bactofilin family)